VNINREPYSNPHAIRAITKKNISFAYFIGLNTTTLNKLDGIPYATVHVDIKEGGRNRPGPSMPYSIGAISAPAGLLYRL
jgi:hypothetical protein